jgi:adenosylcobinamide-phosphate synthase
VSSFLLYTAFAAKDLKVESMEVFRALKDRDLNRARKKLSMIVGRDTNNLSEPEIIRASVETVAENTVDGIISPLFYAFLGGAPLALAYKAVSTLDSMVGYKNERYMNFGWASARLDDLANFIPARISILLLPVASFLTGKDGINSWRVVLRDGRKNPSPNSGIPEAAIAGALRVQLGGVNFYNSVASSEPVIGDSLNTLEAGHIKESIRISHISSALLLLIGIFLSYLALRGRYL